jgi:hypothetical protein
MISVPCRCGRVLSLPDDYAGKTGRCRACGGRLLVPFLREGGGAAVIRAETGPIELEDVAEPIVATVQAATATEPDWILPPDPEPSRPLVSIVEPGEGCIAAGGLGLLRVACWWLLIGGIVKGTLQSDVNAVLVGVAAGIVLLATRRA